MNKNDYAPNYPIDEERNTAGAWWGCAAIIGALALIILALSFTEYNAASNVCQIAGYSKAEIFSGDCVSRDGTHIPYTFAAGEICQRAEFPEYDKFKDACKSPNGEYVPFGDIIKAYR